MRDDGRLCMIRRLRDDDAEAYTDLRREMLLDSPLAFASSPSDDLFSSIQATRERLQAVPESVIFGVFDQRLVGAAGLYRDRHVKSSHKVHLWGMYVVPDHRRKGIAARLLEEVLGYARRLSDVSCVQLSVSSAAPAAQRLYEQAGFRVWGTEPEALRHGGETAVEHHMILRLRDD